VKSGTAEKRLGSIFKCQNSFYLSYYQSSGYDSLTATLDQQLNIRPEQTGAITRVRLETPWLVAQSTNLFLSSPPFPPTPVARCAALESGIGPELGPGFARVGGTGELLGAWVEEEIVDGGNEPGVSNRTRVIAACLLWPNIEC